MRRRDETRTPMTARKRTPFGESSIGVEGDDKEPVDRASILMNGLTHVEMGLRSIRGRHPVTPEVKAMKKSFMDIRSRLMNRFRSNANDAYMEKIDRDTSNKENGSPFRRNVDRPPFPSAATKKSVVEPENTPWTAGNLTPSLFGTDSKSVTNSSALRVDRNEPAVKNLSMDLDAMDEFRGRRTGEGSYGTIEQMSNKLQQRDRQLLELESRRVDVETRLSKVIDESERIVMEGFRKQSDQLSQIDDLARRLEAANVECLEATKRAEIAESRASQLESEILRLRVQLSEQKRVSHSNLVRLSRLQRRQRELVREM